MNNKSLAIKIIVVSVIGFFIVVLLCFIGNILAENSKNYTTEINKNVSFENQEKAKMYYNKGMREFDLFELNHNKNNFKNGLRAMDNAIKLNPNYYEAYVTRGNIMLSMEKYKEAIEDFDKAIELNSNIPDAYSDRAYAKSKMKDYAGAIQDYSKVIELKPEDAHAYILRGMSKLRSGDNAGYKEDYEKYIDIIDKRTKP